MAINDSSDQAALEHHDVNCKLRDTSNDVTFHLIWTLLVCLSNVIGYGEHLFQKWPKRICLHWSPSIVIAATTRIRMIVKTP